MTKKKQPHGKVKAVKKKRIQTGDAVLNRLYTAVRDYVEKKHGTWVVIGGVEIVQEGFRFNYGVMVRVTGKVPILTPKSKRV